jgi:predicted DNA-binding protein with PD1-like motif
LEALRIPVDRKTPQIACAEDSAPGVASCFHAMPNARVCVFMRATFSTTASASDDDAIDCGNTLAQTGEPLHVHIQHSNRQRRTINGLSPEVTGERRASGACRYDME